MTDPRPTDPRPTDPRPTDLLPADHPLPASLTDLFWSFTFLALQGFGGVLAVVQRELVDKKRWMTHDEFVEDWAVAQIMPGPNVVNLALMIGGRYFGLAGALTALAGILAVPLVIVLLLGFGYAQFSSNPELANALRGMGAVAAGLIAATGIKMVPVLKRHPLPAAYCVVLCALVFLFVALLHWPLAPVLLGLGIPACLLTYRRLKS